MKKYIIYSLLAVFTAFTATAQIDRSKIPASGPTPEVNLGEAKEFKLKNGLTVLVVTDTKLPSVSWSLNLNTPPVFEGEKAGVQSLTGALMGKETQLTTKDDFSEKVDFLGASINVSLNGGFGFCLSKYTDDVFSLFAEAALQPKFTQKELDFEKDQLIENIKNNANSAAAIAGDVRGALFYGKNHAAGEVVTEESVKKVTLEDVQNFYNSRFKPSNGYLLFTGDITEKDAKKLLKKYFKSWEAGSVPTPNYPSFEDVATTEVNFVDVPNAVQTELAVMSVSPLKMNDEDYHASLVANYILGGAFGSYLNMNLREANGYTYGARSSLGTGRYYNSSFRATTKVRNEVTDSAVVETLKEIKRIRTEFVDEEVLENAKAKYLGSFILESEDKAVSARRSLSIRTNNLPADFYKNFIANIDAVTKEDVKRVANKYFNDAQARIVLVGKASDVLENVEKIEWNGKKLPVKFFDKEANPTKRPETKVLPEGLTAQTVINSYITAIGGEVNLRKVTSTLVNAEVTIAGAPFKPKAVIKQMAPNKFAMELTAEGMGTLMKQNFDGENGYMEQQGRKMPMDDATLSSRRSSKGLFEELFLDASTMQLESMVAINGADAYKIKITKGDTSSFRYYDAKSGYLVRTEESAEAQGQTMTTTTDFSDYKEVGGVLMPYMMKVTSGPQVLVFETKEAKVNEGVSDADFN